MHNNNEKEWVLVTGGAGFIGAHVAREIAKHPRLGLVVLDDLSGGSRDNVPPEAVFVKGSIVDAKLVADIFDKYKFSYVYHLAAYAAEGLSHFIRRYNYQTNLIGSINVINSAANTRTKCVVFTSSIAVYGAAQVPMREDMTPMPEDPYGISKYAVELDLKSAHEMFGLNYVIFRPHNVYGEFQNIGDKYRNVVGIFMNQILKGEPLTIFGDGTQQRAFSYVGDITSPIVTSAWTQAAYGGAFNIGADIPYTVNELARAVSEAMGVSGHPVRHVEARNEVKNAFSDHSKAASVFGQPKNTSLQDGLREMVAWVRRVGARSTPRFDEIEVQLNLPPSWRS